MRSAAAQQASRRLAGSSPDPFDFLRPGLHRAKTMDASDDRRERTFELSASATTPSRTLTMVFE